MQHERFCKEGALWYFRLSEQVSDQHVSHTRVPRTPPDSQAVRVSQYLKFPAAVRLYMQAFVCPVNRYFCNR